MDDFFTEMKSTLDEIETSNLASETHNSNGVLETYFPNVFIEALVPINPMRWPCYTAGSILSSDMTELGDKIRTPFENLVVAKEYLETSKSDIQWRDRFWKVTEDTARINLFCEIGREPGSFAAGAISNKIADNYMNEMVETSLTLNNQEELNDRIFKQIGLDKGIDPSTIRGTGVIREFVPDLMKGDLCDKPERNARPFDNDNNHGQGRLSDGIILDSKENEFGTSGDSVFESSSCTIENQKNLLDQFFNLFGSRSGEDICPTPIDTEYASTDSPLMEKLWDFFVPESGGAFHCTDPSRMVPPSPFLSDVCDFCPDSN